MKKKHKRIFYISISIITISLGLWLILRNFNQNIVFFYTATEVIENKINNKIIRLGGLVKIGSIRKMNNNLSTFFTLTDNENEVDVIFNGILPNLFRENQGIVSKGIFDGKIFKADELLAKHDENYMPPKLEKRYNK